MPILSELKEIQIVRIDSVPLTPVLCFSLARLFSPHTHTHTHTHTHILYTHTHTTTVSAPVARETAIPGL